MNICFSQTCKLRLLLLSSSRGASKSECFCNSFFRQAPRVMSSSTDELMWVVAHTHTHTHTHTQSVFFTLTLPSLTHLWLSVSLHLPLFSSPRVSHCSLSLSLSLSVSLSRSHSSVFSPSLIFVLDSFRFDFVWIDS